MTEVKIKICRINKNYNEQMKTKYLQAEQKTYQLENLSAIIYSQVILEHKY